MITSLQISFGKSESGDEKMSTDYTPLIETVSCRVNLGSWIRFESYVQLRGLVEM